MNRLACLRLTERCADILLSIREEIHEAGNYVGNELQGPIIKLVEYVRKPRVYDALFTALQKRIHQCPCSHVETGQSPVHQTILETR